MLIPTKLYWLLTGLGIPLALLGVVVPSGELILIPYNLLLLTGFLVSGRIARKWDYIKVERSVDPVLSVRVQNQVDLKVENISDQPITVKVRDEPPNGCDVSSHEFRTDLAALGKENFRYSLTPLQRGSDSFKGTYIRWQAPLGLAWVEKKLKNDAPARIYPNVLAIREYELLKQRGRLDLIGVRKSRVRGLGQEFESLRDYNDDDFRLIDWKASARRGRLVVKNFEAEKNQGLIVCFDIGRHMLGEVQNITKLDFALDSGLMLLNAADREGDQTGLLVFDDEVRSWISPKRGRSQVAAILETIHGLRAEPVQPDYDKAFSILATRWKRRSLIVVFTDVENELEATDLALSLKNLNRRHLLLVVRVSDPRLRELQTADVEATRDMYQRAAALVCADDRQTAADVLKRHGIETLEAEPEDLSAALVSAYLKIKVMNLI